MKLLPLAIISAILATVSCASAQVVTGNGTATSLNVQTLTTGNVLSVTPVTSPDHRYVGMAIHTQFSSLDGVDTFVLTNSTTAGSGTVGGSNGAGGVLGMPGMPQAVAIKRVPFRPAQVGNVVFVDNDKPLLAAKVAAAEWKDASLKEAFRKLSDTTKQNVVLGIRGLEQAGVDVNAKRTYSFPAGTVKDAMLAMLKTGAPETDMVISSEDKVIQISTQAQADNYLVSKTYYLEDLLAAMPRFVRGGTNLNQIGTGDAASEPAPDVVSQIETAGPTDMSKPLPAAKPHAAVKPKAIARPAPPPTNVLEVITDTVRPEIWTNHGGKSEISMVGNRVTIKAPASVHALLDGPKVYNPNKVPMYVNYNQ